MIERHALNYTVWWYEWFGWNSSYTDRRRRLGDW